MYETAKSLASEKQTDMFVFLSETDLSEMASKSDEWATFAKRTLKSEMVRTGTKNAELEITPSRLLKS